MAQYNFKISGTTENLQRCIHQFELIPGWIDFSLVKRTNILMYYLN